MSVGSRLPAEKRNSGDLYPSPSEACIAVGDWLREHAPEAMRRPWRDPTAGYGTLLEWSGVPYEQRHALELSRNEIQGAELARRVPAANLCIGVNSLHVPWSDDANVIANYPFNLLDDFVAKSIAHHLATGRVHALLTPCAFWHAGSRKRFRAPDHLLALTWRPNFSCGYKADGTEGSSPSQDFVWAIYGARRRWRQASARRRLRTLWWRLDKPVAPKEWVVEHERLARIAAGMAPPSLPLFAML